MPVFDETEEDSGGGEGGERERGRVREREVVGGCDGVRTGEQGVS